MHDFFKVLIDEQPLARGDVQTDKKWLAGWMGYNRVCHSHGAAAPVHQSDKVAEGVRNSVLKCAPRIWTDSAMSCSPHVNSGNTKGAGQVG